MTIVTRLAPLCCSSPSDFASFVPPSGKRNRPSDNHVLAGLSSVLESATMVRGRAALSYLDQIKNTLALKSLIAISLVPAQHDSIRFAPKDPCDS